MDPNETLRQLIRAANEGDYASAHRCRADYRSWRSRGGFAASPDLEEQALDALTNLEQETNR